MRRLVEMVVPARLGPPFRWLIASSWATNLGDGIAVAAGPLLVQSLTGDASIVGLGWLLGRLPWLLFGLHAGLAADRFDRRRLLVVANAVRAVVIAVLASAVAADALAVGHVLAALFVIGTAEVVADSSSATLLPMLVDVEDLGVGNARLVFGMTGLNQLLGPFLGAALFVVGASVPFVAQAVVMAGGVLLALPLRLPAPSPGRPLDGTGTSGPGGGPGRDHRGRAGRDIVDGFRWLRGHPPLRTLALTIFAFNVTFGAAWSVLVVLATERLGLGEVGFGLLTMLVAVGGLVGSVLYGATERRVDPVWILRVGLGIETATQLVLATATTAWPALVTMVVFGIHAAMWGTTSSSVRQAAVPARFQGRVGSAYRVGLQGGLVIGSGVGAVLAGAFGVTGPYWFGFVGSALLVVVIWRPLAHLADEPPAR